MTLTQRLKYSNVDLLRLYLNSLKKRKYRLDCGHHVTFGYYLGNDIMIMNGKELRLICSHCYY